MLLQVAGGSGKAARSFCSSPVVHTVSVGRTGSEVSVHDVLWGSRCWDSPADSQLRYEQGEGNSRITQIFT